MKQIMQWMSNVLPKSVDEQSAENRQHQFTVAGKSIHVWSNYGHNSRWLIAKEPNYFGSSFKDANLSLPQSSLNINGARAKAQRTAASHRTKNSRSVSVLVRTPSAN